jgi:hypothetical protein
MQACHREPDVNKSRFILFFGRIHQLLGRPWNLFFGVVTATREPAEKGYFVIN